jgi:hypothetical protein
MIQKVASKLNGAKSVNLGGAVIQLESIFLFQREGTSKCEPAVWSYRIQGVAGNCRVRTRTVYESVIARPVVQDSAS